MIVLGVARPPELVQVAGQTASGTHHDGLRGAQFVHRADQLALTRQRRITDSVDALNLGVPLPVESFGLRTIACLDGVAIDQVEQFLQRHQCITNQRQGQVLEGVKRGHIDVDEAHLGILECRLGGRGEVAVAGTDADDQVSIPSNAVGSEGAGGTNRSEIEWVVEAQAALASHRLANRNACLLDKALQGISGLRVNHAATGDNQRSLTCTNQGCGLLQSAPVRPVARDVPDALMEEGLGIGIRLRLYILGESQCDSTCFRRACQHTHSLRERGQQLLGA